MRCYNADSYMTVDSAFDQDITLRKPLYNVTLGMTSKDCIIRRLQCILSVLVECLVNVQCLKCMYFY